MTNNQFSILNFQFPKTSTACKRAGITALLGPLLLCGLPLRAQTLPLPPRPSDAPGGRALMARVAPMELPEREKEITSQILGGNVPEFLRKLCPIHVSSVTNGLTNTATFYAAPDYLAVGSDDDYFLVPLAPYTAQKIADALKCSLPTRKMVNAIYEAAEVKLAPSPIPPSPAMTSVTVFSNHNATVWAQRSEQLRAHPLGALVAGHKKDVVISARLAAAPRKVAIYGWHQTNGVPIQGLYLGHTARWVDYSQCIRLVQQKMIANGAETTVARVLEDPALSGLLSDEGVIENPRYSTDAAPVSANTNSSATEAVPAGFSGFKDSPDGKERLASFTLEPEVKILVNAPPATVFDAGKKVLLILYALPNGNTIAQTVGKKLEAGDDWHYGIQHIGAQTRFLRQLLPGHPVVVAYLESDQKSWPTWRKAHGERSIPGIVAAVKGIFSTNEVETVLSGHSGGGAFIFGYLDAVDRVPDDVMRMAFLDSDYRYDHALGHDDKLAKWLQASDDHFLCVLAYNDAVALLNGKSFVSAAGGTWGRSHAMESDLSADFRFTGETNADFEIYSALAGRAQFLLRENPEKKVLHTVQVELNGFIHAMVSGTTNESRGYAYFGPAAYSGLIGDQ
jgi:hypothetical protein